MSTFSSAVVEITLQVTARVLNFRSETKTKKEVCGESENQLWCESESSSCSKRLAPAAGERKVQRQTHWHEKNPNESLHVNICLQFQSQLEKQGVTGVKVSWRADKNEPVFQCQKDKEDGSKETGE